MDLHAFSSQRKNVGSWRSQQLREAARSALGWLDRAAERTLEAAAAGLRDEVAVE